MSYLTRSRILGLEGFDRGFIDRFIDPIYSGKYIKNGGFTGEVLYNALVSHNCMTSITRVTSRHTPVPKRYGYFR